MGRVRLMLREHHAVAGLVHGEAHKLRVARQAILGPRPDSFLRLRGDLSPIRVCRVRDWRRGRRGRKGGKRRSKASGFWQAYAFPPWELIVSRP